MPSRDGAREALKRLVHQAEEAKFDYGFLGRLNSAGTEYEFQIPTKPGLVYCQVQRGMAVEHAECVPRVALNPYVRCKFKTVRGVLVAVEFDPLDGVNAYGFESGGLDLPTFPLPEWGALPPPPMFGDPVVKLLHAGVASAGKDRFLRLAAESGTADDCDGLTGLEVGDEAWLFADTGDTITLKHNSGSPTDKFFFYNEADIEITDAKGLRVLKRASGAIVNSVDADTGGGGGGGAAPDFDEDSTSELSITDTSAAAGSNSASIVFTAPASGKVLITVSGHISIGNNTHRIALGYELREGNSVGSGTVVQAADTDYSVITGRAVNTSAQAEVSADRRKLVTGLTDGDEYNVQTMRWVTGGAGEIYYRALLVEYV